MNPTLRRWKNVPARPIQQNTRRCLQTLAANLTFLLLALLVGCGGGRTDDSDRRTSQPLPPSVTGVSPSLGPRRGGTPVTITGSGFIAGATVSIGGSACISPNVISGTQITCTTGAGPAGSADIVVINPGGLSGRLASGFVYLTALFVDGDGPNGLNKDTSQDARAPRLASLDGRLYVTWTEDNAASASSQIRVIAYEGNDDAPRWEFVDGSAASGLNKDATQAAIDPSLMVFNGKLYAMWSERSAATGASQVRIAVYNGSDRLPPWRFVDGNGANGINKNVAKDAHRPRLAVFNSKLYATWSENDNGPVEQIRAVVYNSNDLAPAWEFVDGDSPTAGLNKNPARPAAEPSLIAFNSKLYAAWEEVGSHDYQVRVAAYEGDDASPRWSFVDGNGMDGLSKDPSASSSAATLVVYNSKLYLAWLEDPGVRPTQLRVAVNTGSEWKFVDGNGPNGINHDPNLFAAFPADFPALLAVGNSLYCAWREGFIPGFPLMITDQVRLAAYNGNDSSPAWLFADGNGSIGLNKNPSKNAGAVQLAVLNSKLYLAWEEENADSKLQIRVATIP